MLYADFIESMHYRTRISKKDIQLILEAIPGVLLELQKGDNVRLPMGTFRIVHTKERRCVYPEGRGEGVFPEQLVIKMTPSKQLKITADNPLWDCLLEPLSYGRVAKHERSKKDE
jgi:nucleoid DNA-binding protein